MGEIRLNPKEKKVLEGLLKKLKVPKRKTHKHIAVGMVGLVGSGKSTVAEVFGRELGAVVIDPDDIRVLLRKSGNTFAHLSEIVLQLVQEILAQEGNVVIASDFVDPEKRNLLKKITKDAEMRAFFVRTMCAHDTMIGRILSGTYTQSILGGAPTAWQGKHKGATVKVREMWRRTPLHYSWMHEGGGKWVQKSMPFVFDEIDTTDQKKWKEQVKKMVRSFG